MREVTNTSLNKRCYDLNSKDESGVKKSIILAPGETGSIEDGEVSSQVERDVEAGILVISSVKSEAKPKAAAKEEAEPKQESRPKASKSKKLKDKEKE